MIGPEAAAKGVAAIAAGAFALVVALPRGGGRSAKTLGAFLALIAANQTIEAIRATQGAPDLALARTAAVFASLDPLALVLFAASLEGIQRVSTREVGGVAALSAGFAIVGGWLLTLDPRALEIYALGLNFFTLVVYATVLARVARAAQTRAGLRPLVVAMAIATIPLGPRTLDSAVGTAFHFVAGPGWLGVAISFVVGVAIVLAHAAWLVDRVAVRWTDVVPGLAVGALLLSYNPVAFLQFFFGGIDTAPYLSLGRAGAALRWMLFGALASVAIIRNDILAFSLVARRRAARVMLAVGVFAVVALGLSIAGLFVPRLFEIRPLDVVLVVVLLALTQGLRGVTERIARATYGLPLYAKRGAQEHYRQAAARVVARGDDPARDETLARLRQELELDGDTAEVLHRIAEEDSPLPLVAGALVVGRYRIERPVVRGAGGRAFLARDELMMRDVILKEIPSPAGARADASSPDAVRASASQHPHLVTVFNVLRRGPTTVLVQEDPGGRTLQERLAEGALPEAARIEVVDDVAEGLAELHAVGVAHGDVRSANVILGANGEAKLVDFGLRRGSIADDVRAVGLLARELVPAAPPRRAGVIERAIRGEIQDARALLEAWRAAA